MTGFEGWYGLFGWEKGFRCQMLGRECPEAVLPDTALYLPTSSHFFIVNKLLYLSLSPGRKAKGVKALFPS